MVDLRKNLNEDLDIATWDMLELHLTRGALVEVHNSLDLVEVGLAVAEDKEELVKDWMAKGLIKNMGEVDQEWKENKDLKFKFLILSPYVLVQVLRENN